MQDKRGEKSSWDLGSDIEEVRLQAEQVITSFVHHSMKKNIEGGK
jgi:hypothetical protein